MKETEINQQDVKIEPFTYSVLFAIIIQVISIPFMQVLFSINSSSRKLFAIVCELKLQCGHEN